MSSKKVFVDSCCNIPTIDLQRNNVTRKRSPSTADICIVPNELDFKSQINSFILFNNNTNEYLILDHFGYVYNKDIQNKLNSYYINYREPKNIISTLQNNGILNGFQLCYDGNVLGVTSQKLHNLILNYKYYHHCIYESNYISFINEVCEDIDLEIINNVYNMLRSDLETANLGLQLLYPYNPSKYAYSLLKMFSKVGIYRLSMLPFFSSNKFKSFSSRLGLSPKQLGNYEFFRDKLYDIVCDEEKNYIMNDIFNQFNSSYRTLIDNLKRQDIFKYIEIEHLKLIYNGENRCDPRKQE